MAKVETSTIELDDGTIATFHKKDVDAGKISEYPAVCENRQMGSAPHFSVQQGLLQAIAGDESKADLVIGTKGETKVLSSSLVANDILNFYIEGHSYAIAKVACNRGGAKKELVATKEALSSITDPAVIEALKAAGVKF